MTDQPPIDAKFCQARTFMFHPATEGQAVSLQKKLFELGCRWQESGQNIRHINDLVHGTLKVDRGTMTYNDYRMRPGAGGHELCDVRRLLDESDNLSERTFLLSQFNGMRQEIEKLNGRIDALGNEVRQLRDLISPPPLDKRRSPGIIPQEGGAT